MTISILNPETDTVHTLGFLDSRLDLVFWVKLSADLKAIAPQKDFALKRLHEDGFPTAGIQWISDAAGLILKEDTKVSELAARIEVLCSEQIILSQKQLQLPLNHLILDLQKSDFERSRFDRLIRSLTDYPSFALFLADVVGSFMLPAIAYEPRHALPSSEAMLTFEIEDHLEETQELCNPNDWSLRWDSVRYLRGGASTLSGAFDVLMQVAEESQRIMHSGLNTTTRPVGCSIKLSGRPILFAKIDQARGHKQQSIKFEAMDPKLGQMLGNQSLMAWVAEQYERRGRTLDIASYLEQDLGL